MTSYQVRRTFWREAIALQGSHTIQVLPSVLAFGFVSGTICGGAWLCDRLWHLRPALDTNSFGFVGVALGILLVIRLNAGYERWWEARRQWGSIVNQSRNLVIGSLAYGPDQREWRESIVRWTAVFAHAARHSLRSESPGSEIVSLLAPQEVGQLSRAHHMPSFVAGRIGDLLREACERLDMDRFAFLRLDQERAQLMNHLGACERIRATPLPRLYSVNIRQFILLFLLILPFGLLHQFQPGWFVPLATMMIAYPLLTLDQIGVELEDPFSTANQSHLPIDELSRAIQQDLLALLEERESGQR